MPSPNSAPRSDELVRAEEILQHFERIEAQFQQVREGLTHSHRLTTLGTLASILAHEYNNILTPILSYAQLALSKPDDHDLMRKAVERALAGAQRAAHISSSLLGFAREGDGAVTAKLRVVIDDTIACLARDPRKDGMDLTIDVPDLTLAISPLKLQQVLLNLVLNAKQAMRRHGGKLKITATVESGVAHIDVSDSGPGIPPQIIDRLFQPFVTMRPDYEASEKKGTGLGLCICRDLVRSVGGDISAENSPGHGATFHIKLPVAGGVFEST